MEFAQSIFKSRSNISIDFQKKKEYLFWFNLLGICVFIIQSFLRIFGDFSWIYYLGDTLMILTFSFSIIAIKYNNLQTAGSFLLNLLLMPFFYYIYEDFFFQRSTSYLNLYNTIVLICIGILVNGIFSFSRKQILIFTIMANAITILHGIVLYRYLNSTSTSSLISYLISGTIVYSIVTLISLMFFSLTHDLLKEKEHELTEVKQLSTQQKLEYKSLFENSDLGIAYHKIILDEDGRPIDYIPLDINPKFTSLTGLTRDQFLNKRVSHTIPQLNEEGWIEIYGKVALLQETVSFENYSEYLGKWFNISAYSPKKYYFVTLVTDISIQKQKTKALIQEQKLSSVSKLAGGIAHDFNNILVGILGNIDLLKFSETTFAESLEIINDLESAALKASNLAKQLLTFAKGGPPQKKVIDIYQIIEDAAKLSIRNHAMNLELKKGWKPEECEMNLLADPDQIYQVFLNLFLNAIESEPSSNTITVKTEMKNMQPNNSLKLPSGYYLLLFIEDTGRGIPKKVEERIFEPYFSTKPAGNGLGLATTYSIIKKHRGFIDFHSVEGKGTIFRIILPLIASKKEKDIIQSNPIPKSSSFAGKVLILDDEPFIHKILTYMLNKLNYTTVSTYNGSDTLEKYLEGIQSHKPYDFVILDYIIPSGLNGLETMRILKTYDPTVKAIISSGYTDDSVVTNFKEQGFIGNLPKPYTFSMLESLIANISRT